MTTTNDAATGSKVTTKRSKADAAVAEKLHEEERLNAIKNYKLSLGNLLESRATFSKSNLLYISSRISNLDPVAEQALKRVKDSVEATPQVARKVLDMVAKKGWATELVAVNKRLNRLHMSENKRLVLAAVYPALLADLLSYGDKEVEESLKDTVGFADSVIYKLEDKDGALDLFAEEIVDGICEKNRISFKDEEHLRDLVTYQVRAGL